MLGICLALIDEPSDKDKFKHLYYTYNDMMFNVAMSVLHNKALADETVQDCFLKLAEKIAEISDVQSKKTKALIIIMIKNMARNNLKAEHYDRAEPLGDNEITDTAFNEVLSDLGYKSLVDIMDSLDSIYRDVLVLKFVNELSVNEISELLEIPYRTVETRIFRGRRIIKEKLEEMYNECNF